MAIYGYIFVDIEKKYRVSSAEQQSRIDAYCQDFGSPVDNYYIEQYISAWRPFVERTQASGLLETCQENDLIVACQSDAIFCRPKDGLHLIDLLTQKNVSLHLLDLGGDIVHQTERKLVISTGMANPIHQLLTTLAKRERPVRESDPDHDSQP